MRKALKAATGHPLARWSLWMALQRGDRRDAGAQEGPPGQADPEGTEVSEMLFGAATVRPTLRALGANGTWAALVAIGSGRTSPAPEIDLDPFPSDAGWAVTKPWLLAAWRSLSTLAPEDAARPAVWRYVGALIALTLTEGWRSHPSVALTRSWSETQQLFRAFDVPVDAVLAQLALPPVPQEPRGPRRGAPIEATPEVTPGVTPEVTSGVKAGAGQAVTPPVEDARDDDVVERFVAWWTTDALGWEAAIQDGLLRQVDLATAIEADAASATRRADKAERSLAHAQTRITQLEAARRALQAPQASGQGPAQGSTQGSARGSARGSAKSAESAATQVAQATAQVVALTEQLQTAKMREQRLEARNEALEQEQTALKESVARAEAVAHTAAQTAALLAPPTPELPAPPSAPPTPSAAERALLATRTVYLYTNQKRGAVRAAMEEALRDLGVTDVLAFEFQQGGIPGPQNFPATAIVLVDTAFSAHADTTAVQQRARRSGVLCLLDRVSVGSVARIVMDRLLPHLLPHPAPSLGAPAAPRSAVGSPPQGAETPEDLVPAGPAREGSRPGPRTGPRPGRRR